MLEIAQRLDPDADVDHGLLAELRQLEGEEVSALAHGLLAREYAWAEASHTKKQKLSGPVGIAAVDVAGR